MKSYRKLHKHDFADTVPPITGHFEPRLREKAVRVISPHGSLIYSVSPLVMARMVCLVSFSLNRRTLCFTPSP